MKKKILTQEIPLGDHGFIGVLCLNRPERRNALDQEMLIELNQVLKKWRKGPCRMLLLLGKGSHFCSGFDLNEIRKQKRHREKSLGYLEKLFRSLAGFPVPTVSIVHGHVTAGGVVLSASCDYTLAHEASRFSLTEGKLGFASGITYPLLLRRMDLNTLNEMILLGRTMEPTKLLQRGFLLETGGWKALDGAFWRMVEETLLIDRVAQEEFKRFLSKEGYYQFPKEKEWAKARALLKKMLRRKPVLDRVETFLTQGSLGAEVPKLSPWAPSRWIQGTL
jgi:methylglutaconyl-CoA hydratase